jgi:hydrogenase nickel incorporation protein HypB
MCKTCGCDDDAGVRVIDLDSVDPGVSYLFDGVSRHQLQDQHSSSHSHPHDHEHSHEQAPHDHGPLRMIELDQRILAKNDDLADGNRQWFAARGIVALNLMSSPGSGKTTLLVRTVADLADTMPVAVIEGDQETVFDAERIRATGCRVVQINTGAGCHLDATMLADGVTALAPPNGSVVFIENVGNLVCPALFDLGEAARVVIMSVTEGADKPLKYPHMFRSADLVVINKIDLLPYVDFDVSGFRAAALAVNPTLEFIEVSATKATNLATWYAWLAAHRA